jgi:hypothetical protein
MRSNTSICSLVVAGVLSAACVRAPSGPKVVPEVKHVSAGLTIAVDGNARAGAAFTIVAMTKIDRHPYPKELVIGILTSGERVVSQTPFVFDAVKGKAKITVPGPGSYRLEIWEEGKFVIGNTFVASSLPALDGKRSFELHQDAAPRMMVHRDSPSEVVWQHWDSVDKDEAFVAEWWRDGNRIAAAGGKRSSLQREVLARVQNVERVDALGLHPAWKWTTEKFTLPDTLLRSEGHWELRVYRDEQVSIGFTFEVDVNGEVHGGQKQTATDGSVELEVNQVPTPKDVMRQLAKFPHTKFEGSKKFLLPVTVAEVRALTRSEVLRNQRVRLNALSHQGINSDPTMNSFGGSKDQSRPLDNEAKALVTSMQKLIAALGEPWNDDERP